MPGAHLVTRTGTAPVFSLVFQQKLGMRLQQVPGSAEHTPSLHLLSTLKCLLPQGWQLTSVLWGCSLRLLHCHGPSVSDADSSCLKTSGIKSQDCHSRTSKGRVTICLLYAPEWDQSLPQGGSREIRDGFHTCDQNSYFHLDSAF